MFYRHYRTYFIPSVSVRKNYPSRFTGARYSLRASNIIAPFPPVIHRGFVFESSYGTTDRFRPYVTGKTYSLARTFDRHCPSSIRTPSRVAYILVVGRALSQNVPVTSRSAISKARGYIMRCIFWLFNQRRFLRKKPITIWNLQR